MAKPVTFIKLSAPFKIPPVAAPIAAPIPTSKKNYSQVILSLVQDAINPLNPAEVRVPPINQPTPGIKKLISPVAVIAIPDIIFHNEFSSILATPKNPLKGQS